MSNTVVGARWPGGGGRKEGSGKVTWEPSLLSWLFKTGVLSPRLLRAVRICWGEFNFVTLIQLHCKWGIQKWLRRAVERRSMETKRTSFCCTYTQPCPAEPSVLPIQGSTQPRRGIDRDTSNQHHRSELRSLHFSHCMSYLEFSRENHKGQGKFNILSKVLLLWLSLQ